MMYSIRINTVMAERGQGERVERETEGVEERERALKMEATIENLHKIQYDFERQANWQFCDMLKRITNIIL